MTSHVKHVGKWKSCMVAKLLTMLDKTWPPNRLYIWNILIFLKTKYILLLANQASLICSGYLRIWIGCGKSGSKCLEGHMEHLQSCDLTSPLPVLKSANLGSWKLYMCDDGDIPEAHGSVVNQICEGFCRWDYWKYM